MRLYMMSARLATAKQVVVPTLIDATVKSATAGYATVVATGLSWFGRSIVFPNDVDANQKSPSAHNNSTLGVSEKIQQMISDAPETISVLAAAGFQQLKSPVGMATIGSALSDTAIERSCDLIAHLSKRQVSRLIKELEFIT